MRCNQCFAEVDEYGFCVENASHTDTHALWPRKTPAGYEVLSCSETMQDTSDQRIEYRFAATYVFAATIDCKVLGRTVFVNHMLDMPYCRHPPAIRAMIWEDTFAALDRIELPHGKDAA